eukprot:359517-Chlamydomonas_euryale.AAC.26
MLRAPLARPHAAYSTHTPVNPHACMMRTLSKRSAACSTLASAPPMHSRGAPPCTLLISPPVGRPPCTLLTGPPVGRPPCTLLTGPPMARPAPSRFNSVTDLGTPDEAANKLLDKYLVQVCAPLAIPVVSSPLARTAAPSWQP